MTQNPRKKAVNILVDIEKNASYVNIEMNKLRIQNDFSYQDIRFIGELINGVQKRKITLDYIISIHSSVKINKISPFVLAVLRSGIYQILYMDKVPASAAVNESVKLIKKSSVARLSGYVNAVLRAVNGNELTTLDNNSPFGLSIIYSLPQWLVSRWISQFGLSFAKNLMEAFLAKTDLCVRRNPNISEDKFLNKLSEDGITVVPFKFKDFKDFDYCYTVQTTKGPITDTIAFKEGCFYIQDPAAALASYLLQPKQGDFIIDMCAAPGGKSIFLAELMQNKGKIISFDIYEHKINLINDNAKRHNIDIIHPFMCDATVYNENYENFADKIICDVPCSGFGLISKKPDIRHTRKEEDIVELFTLSQKILENAARYLKPGGVLVFSTCTIDMQENEKAIETFLNNHREFSFLPFGENQLSFKTFYPSVDGTDGFFVCRLKKSEVSK